MRTIEEIYKSVNAFSNRKQFTKELKKEGYDIVGIRWYDAEEYVEVAIGNTKDNPYYEDGYLVLSICIDYFN